MKRTLSSNPKLPIEASNFFEPRPSRYIKALLVKWSRRAFLWGKNDCQEESRHL